MYFPILRGRQFELIALRELSEYNLIGNRVIPIIEPVKPTSTLISTLSTFREKGLPIAVIRNPRVGDMISILNDSDNNTVRDKFFAEIENNGFISTFYVDNKDAINRDSLLIKGIIPDQCIAICLNKDSIQKHTEMFNENEPQYTLISDERTLKRTITGKKIILSDNFIRRKRNTDYILDDDESFTEDNVFFAEEGYAGFSDYSIVGSDYDESGFAPYAVVIHIVYLGADQSLRIHHFVSDSNETINDPAGKFYEALKKFHEWNLREQLTTWAAGELERLFEVGQYPGLGTIKKLSIMHHLELVNKYLEGDQL